MVVKEYTVSTDFSNGVYLVQLEDEITTDGSVQNFEGLTLDGDTLSVLGSSLINETNLNAVISSHTPDYTTLYVKNTVQQNKAFADQMMQRLKEKNILEGLSSIDQSAWVHHRLRKVDYTMDDGVTIIQLDVLNLVVSGDIETADKILGQIAADDMTETYHWLNQDRIDWIRNEIRTYLGWPLV